MNAVITYADRFLKAARMGVLWNGTTRFTLPKRFKYNSIACSIVALQSKVLPGSFAISFSMMSMG
jgi:hypothetical protein